MLFEIILDIHFIPLQNKYSPILVGSKLQQQSFECRQTSLFRRAVVLQKNESIEGTNVSRTPRKHKGWILLGYPSNTSGYLSKYCNYTSKRKLGLFPRFPRTHFPGLNWYPPGDNFFNIHLIKNILLNKKDVVFSFRIGCILILVFINNKRAIQKF